MNLGRDEARYWHRRIYSGLVRISFFSEPCAPDAYMYALKTPLTQVLPSDIGAAAAYEAYRTWKHNSFLYEPLSADREQQREGIIGMAIAEGAYDVIISPHTSESLPSPEAASHRSPVYIVHCGS